MEGVDLCANIDAASRQKETHPVRDGHHPQRLSVPELEHCGQWKRNLVYARENGRMQNYVIINHFWKSITGYYSKENQILNMGSSRQFR